MKHFIEGQLIGLKINMNIDGKLYAKSCPTEEAADAFFNAIIAAKANPTDEAVEMLLLHLNQSMRRAAENGLEYDLETSNVYLPGFNTPLPNLLVETIEKYHEKGFPMNAILNFWKLLMINPDERVRTKLFDFIATHDFSITENGYMVVYKALEYLDSIQKDLNTFVTSTSLFVRKEWTCSPKKYGVYQRNEDGAYYITKQKTLDKWDEKAKNITKIGNLGVLEAKSKELSNDPASVKFLPTHVARNKSTFNVEKETVRLGIPQTMERHACDSDPSIDCSYGLHVGATAYVKKFRGWTGNTSPVLACLVNPAHVIAVPDYDHSKMRVCEYFPYALCEVSEDGEINTVDQPFFEHDYREYEVDELERQIKAINNNTERVGVDTFEAEDNREVEEVLKALKDRVVEIEKV